MITFQVEGWDKYYGDPRREGLWWEHYRELEPAHSGQMEMGPDVEMFRQLDRLGALVIVTARELGELVGYCLVVVKRHTHYKAFCGFEDSYFLTPSARKGSTGLRLIKETLRVLDKRGCSRSYWMTKEFASVGRLFERLGMTKMDSVYVRVKGTGRWER